MVVFLGQLTLIVIAGDERVAMRIAQPVITICSILGSKCALLEHCNAEILSTSFSFTHSDNLQVKHLCTGIQSYRAPSIPTHHPTSVLSAYQHPIWQSICTLIHTCAHTLLQRGSCSVCCTTTSWSLLQ